MDDRSEQPERISYSRRLRDVGLSRRAPWVVTLCSIIAIGILSRVARTGLVIFDKYLGDALYAAMVYTILRWCWEPKRAAVSAAVAMTAIETFQLTLIPHQMLSSAHLILRICARLLGTEFSFSDLVAYGIGIALMYLFAR
jgi:hypothetical protein